jgi:hypothetical protein
VAVVVKALGSKLELDAHTPPELDVGVPLARLPEFAARVVDEVARVPPAHAPSPSATSASPRRAGWR